MPLRFVAQLLILAGGLTAVATACSSPFQPDDGVSGQSGQSGTLSPSTTLTVSTVTPASGPVGTMVTIAGRGFAAKDNAAAFGMGYLRNLESSDGTTLTFVVPEALDLCPPGSTAPCAGAHPRTKAGDYTIRILIDGLKSNAVTFTVTP